MLSALRDHAPPGRLHKLSTLDIHHLDVAELEILLELARRPTPLPLRLATFVISSTYGLGYDYGNLLRMLHEFLESQSDSLRHLSVEFSTGSLGAFMATIPVIATVDLPTLPAVHSLHFACHGMEPEHHQQSSKWTRIRKRVFQFSHSRQA